MSNPSSAPAEGDLGAALAAEFLSISRRHLEERLRRIEACLEKLSEEQVWSRQHENENAIGNLVLHLCGNLRQWILSGVGGAPDRRDRDAEFARREPLPVAELRRRLRQTVEEAEAVLAPLSPQDLMTTRKIQVYDVSVLHAIYHVVEHFGQHAAQIIWATKHLTGQDLGFYRYLGKDKEKATAAEQKRQP